MRRVSLLLLLLCLLPRATAERLSTALPPSGGDRWGLGQGKAAEVVCVLHDAASDYVVVVAHRGDWRNWPENSLPAIESVIGMGVDVMELDLKMTRDSVLVLSHDATLDRCTTGSGCISDFTYKELLKYDLKRGHGIAIPGLKIPTLRQALEVCKDRIVVNVDQGYDYYDQVLALTEELGMTDQVLIKSRRLRQEVEARFRQHPRNMMYMPVVNIEPSGSTAVLDSFLQAPQPPLAFELCFGTLDEAVRQTAHQVTDCGSKVWVNTIWGSLCGGYDDDRAFASADADEVYGPILDLGTSIIQTDRPELLISYLEQKGRRTLPHNLRSGFQNPPQEALPRVWWHWMDGNITEDGIRKDIEWMHRSGIGGFHCFEAGTGIRPVVGHRLTYMSEEWKDAFRLATSMADSLGMEVAIASCPGWSNTGGPWVKPEQAMKRLVWSEQRVAGGHRLTVTLSEPKNEQWYKDTYVVAVRANKADRTPEELGARYTRSSEGESPVWIQYEFRKPVTVKAMRIADGHYRSIWAALPAPVTKHLEVSDDGSTFRRVCDIPHGSVYWQTLEIGPATARYFRVVFDDKPTVEPEWQLFTTARINHCEEKAGFASPSDMNDHPTSDADGEAVPLTDVIDLTGKMDADGQLTWDAPKGTWTIYRFGYTLTGKQNHPAPAEATGLEVTKLDKEAFAAFLEYYLDTYRQTTDKVRYLLIDSYEAGWETWAPHIVEEFEQRRGYSLLPWMPVLTGQIIGSAQQSETFLFDWRTTIGELIDECMYENATRIAHQYGLQTYFEAHENGRLYLVDGMSAKHHADIPMAAMWTVNPAEKALHSSARMAESDIRESASVAHLYGKPIVAAESMTVNGDLGSAYSYYPGNLKPTADLEMACGVNRFVIHESAHQPVDDNKPGLGLMQYGQWFNRHETWAAYARPWTDYLSRSCYLLQQGRNVADVLYYYGEDDVVTSLFAHEHPAVPAGYNYDYLNKEALLSIVSFDGSHFVTPAGARYRVLIIGRDCKHVSPSVSEKIEALKQQGAPVFDEKTVTVADALQGTSPDFGADAPGDLRFVHRTTGEEEIYWVSNRRNEARTIRATFRVSGLTPKLWHPDTGDVEAVAYEQQADRTTVELQLSRHDAVFVVFERQAAKGVETPARTLQKSQISNIKYQISNTTLHPSHCIEVVGEDSPWTVHFDTAWGGPETAVFDRLMSYTDSEDKGIKYYSGTATYFNNVSLTPQEMGQGRLILDLGRVGCMAEVIVNGRNMGVLWKEPYALDVTEALRPGRNELEIRVVNQWVNRIIGDRQPDCEKRYTTTPRAFYRADSPLLPAGLMGPVKVISGER